MFSLRPKRSESSVHCGWDTQRDGRPRVEAATRTAAGCRFLARRPAVGASGSRVFVVLPVVADPILLILYLDHGSRFAAQAARAATLGIVPLALFALVSAICPDVMAGC
jgi:hypothetical protein